MKILIINYEFPPLGGGAGNASYYLARHLSKIGHDIAVLTSAFHGLPGEESCDGFRIFRAPVIRRKIDRCSVFEMITFVISGLFFCKTVINNFKPEKVVAFFGIPSGIIAYWMKKRYRLPYVISLRGGDVPGFFVKKLRFYHYLTRPVIKSVWKEAEHVIANSNRLYELAKQTDPNTRISVIPNGVDTDKYKPICGKHTENAKIKIVTVGRLSEQKGLRAILKACYILNQNGLQGKFTLEIVGDGPSRRMLEELSSDLCLQDVVSFSGWIPREQITARYNAADIFVLSSLDEGMSNALLEAMATGLPVVASDFAGDNLLVNDVNALVVPVNNDQLLSIALKQLILDKDLREKLGQKGMMITKEYSWENVARAYDSLCKTNIIKEY